MNDHTGRGLTFGNFRQIGKNGIGDSANAYVHGMGFFEGRLYAGMTRNSMKLLKLFPPIDPPALDPWPVDVPPSVEDLDMQGQIWRWTPEDETWEMAYRSPLILGKNGKQVPRDLGYRGMQVFQGASDPKPVLYASTMSTVLRGCAAHVLRSEDGLNFEPASEPGIGNPRISTFRELVAFDGHLYAPPAGEGIQFNSNRRSVVMRSADPRPGNWEQACEPGFGDPTNNGIFMMTVAGNFLYAGTFNSYEGYQIWRTPANGGGPCEWSQVMERGAYRGPIAEIAMGLCEFNGALYVGSSIQNGGYDRTNLVGPAAGEIIRIWPDGSWDLLVGSPRDTPDGMKFPLSGIGPGFDNIFSGYIWRMCVHDGWLYVTTFDWSVFLQYAHRPSPTAKRLVNAVSFEKLAEVGGGFELWRTADGVNWIPVSINGMNNPYNYGGRTMVSTPVGLFLGTANPFGGKTPARFASRWEYHDNPDGGTEVFLGNGSFRPYRLPKPPRAGTASRPHPDVAVICGVEYVCRAVVGELAKAGYRMRLLVEPGAGDAFADHDAELIEGHPTDAMAVRRLIRDAPLVFHAPPGLPGSRSLETLRRMNVTGTQTLLRAAGESDALRRVVFASSVSVYQNQFNEAEWPLHEASPLRLDGGDDLAEYGMTMIAGENLLRHYAKKFGFEHAILRFALIYGPGDPVIDPLVREHAVDPLFGWDAMGEQPRQFVHVDDASEAVLRACFAPEAANETFTIAGSEVITYRHLGRMMRIAVGIASTEDLRPDRTRVWQRYQQQFDIAKARTRLGFTPSVPLAHGLREIIETAQATGDLPGTAPAGAGERAIAQPDQPARHRAETKSVEGPPSTQRVPAKAGAGR